ncbi:MAG TPA: LON peptidase substrate-binding domain-containing protein, partial [Candidatus Dormibacteraeota bacterium]|nr:LON peptidase substrate-binding domain-containing protein [Candidatus Dormibacteraeota bacterium]
MPVRLPLFPLNTVLFPHMPAGLHIFEERYREMIRDCQEQGTSFGVVGIREGLEVGRAAFPFAVGTLAQIHELEALDDGTFNIVVAGASRFRVESFSLTHSYLAGSIRYLEDTRGEEAAIPELARRARLAFIAYMAGLRNLADEAGDEAAPAELPDDPELLSYLIAASLQVEVNRRQELLEEDSASGRLSKCLRTLRRESVFLDQMLARRDHIVPVSL